MNSNNIKRNKAFKYTCLLGGSKAIDRTLVHNMIICNIYKGVKQGGILSSMVFTIYMNL